MSDARAAGHQGQAEMDKQKNNELITVHRHAIQLVIMRAAQVAAAKHLVKQSLNLGFQLLIANRHAYKAAAETASQVAIRKMLSSQLAEQSRRRAFQATVAAAAHSAAGKAFASHLVEQSTRHNEELLAERRSTFKAVAQAAAFAATAKALAVQLTAAQLQPRDVQTAQLAFQALEVDSFDGVIHAKCMREAELFQAGARIGTLEKQVAALKLSSSRIATKHAGEIADKDWKLQALNERFDEQTCEITASNADTQEREAQLSLKLTSRTRELAALQQCSDEQAIIHAAAMTNAQKREAHLTCKGPYPPIQYTALTLLSVELFSCTTDLKSAHKEVEAVNIECAAAAEQLREASIRADMRKADIIGLYIEGLGACATKLSANYERRLCIDGQQAQDQREVVTALRQRLHELQCADESAADEPEGCLPSPPPTPELPPSPMLSNSGFEPSCVLPGAEDKEHLSITTLNRLPPPFPVDVRNQRWIGPSFRRGVLLCGVFSGYGPTLIDKPSLTRNLQPIIDDISTVGIPRTLP
ncbi:hypothetical protein PENSPDRAFT_111093 [Peniophora sp. CONT]|nr:hypothetical protein PENSPDRAFT_111093 [Peniophora sp. CONT]